MMPIVLDFMRKVAVSKGKILIIERERNSIMRETLLLCLTHIFQTNTYEAYTLIRSQNLNFKLPEREGRSCLPDLSNFIQYHQQVSSYL